MKNAEPAQKEQLRSLLRTASETEWGAQFGFPAIDGYREFSRRVPVSGERRLEKLVNALKEGEAGIAWPGSIRRFAVSAGTTGSGKHLPVTPERLRSDRRFMRKILFSYLRQRPAFWRVTGSQLSIPGSLETRGSLELGEISAFTALNAPALLRPLQVIPPAEAVRISLSEKLDRVVERAEFLSPRVISAAPSWLLTLFERALRKSGRDTVRELWPRLRLLVCGGVKLSSYRARLEELLGERPPDFIETYGASEGYFAYTDRLGKREMRLVADNGIFYEFIPDPLPETEAAGIQQCLPLWEVETGVPYGLVVTTNAGLWRCPVNDVVEFTSLHPPRMVVRGRLSEMLDDYGEALALWEAEEALAEASSEMDLRAGAFAILAFLPGESGSPRHRWYLQLYAPVHRQTVERLAARIDEKLRHRNRHYDIRRESGALDAPILRIISQRDINRLLEATGRRKAQGKLPRVLNRREAEILEPV